MKVVITGGTGFIGQMLARQLLEKGTLIGSSGQPEVIDEIVLHPVKLQIFLIVYKNNDNTDNDKSH